MSNTCNTCRPIFSHPPGQHARMQCLGCGLTPDVVVMTRAVPAENRGCPTKDGTLLWRGVALGSERWDDDLLRAVLPDRKGEAAAGSPVLYGKIWQDGRWDDQILQDILSGPEDDALPLCSTVSVSDPISQMEFLESSLLGFLPSHQEPDGGDMLPWRQRQERRPSDSHLSTVGSQLSQSSASSKNRDTRNENEKLREIQARGRQVL